MSLVLSSEDCRRLEDTLTTLLSPLNYSTCDDWQVAVCNAGADLIGTSRSTFLANADGQPNHVSVGIEPSTIAAYGAYYHKLDFVLEESLASASSIIMHRELRRNREKEVLGSEIFNDFYLPNDFIDSIALVVKTGERHALLNFCHEQPDAENFGERGAALLRLLQPAVAAGAATMDRLAAVRHTLWRVLDGLAHGMAVFDAGGRCLHSNAMLERWILQEPCGNQLRMQVAWFARDSRPLGNRTVFQGASGRYELSKSFINDGDRMYATVLVEMTGIGGLTDAQADAWQLTSTERIVGSLVARGLSNKAIAKELDKSPHTVRHHVEAILRKSDSASRAAFVAKI